MGSEGIAFWGNIINRHEGVSSRIHGFHPHPSSSTPPFASGVWLGRSFGVWSDCCKSSCKNGPSVGNSRLLGQDPQNSSKQSTVGARKKTTQVHVQYGRAQLTLNKTSFAPKHYPLSSNAKSYKLKKALKGRAFRQTSSKPQLSGKPPAPQKPLFPMSFVFFDHKKWKKKKKNEKRKPNGEPATRCWGCGCQVPRANMYMGSVELVNRKIAKGEGIGIDTAPERRRCGRWRGWFFSVVVVVCYVYYMFLLMFFEDDIKSVSWSCDVIKTVQDIIVLLSALECDILVRSVAWVEVDVASTI